MASVASKAQRSSTYLRARRKERSSGKTVRGDRGTERASQENAGVGNEEKRSPENGWADGEMVFDMAGAGAEFGVRLAVFVETIFAEAGVSLLIVVREIEAVLDQRGAGVSVIAHAIAAHPGIKERQRKQKEHEEKALRLMRTWLR